MLHPPLPLPESPTLDPSLLSAIASPSIFPLILAYCTRPTLYSCLRVSRSISHQAAAVLFRNVDLLDILPSSILNPYTCAPRPRPGTGASIILDTRSQFLPYVRTLRMPQCLLYDPRLCAALIRRMRGLRTVVVPQSWPGWVLHPQLKYTRANVFDLHPDRDRYGGKGSVLTVVVVGVSSPAQYISPGLVQSGLLDKADEVILHIEHYRPVYRTTRGQGGRLQLEFAGVQVDKGPRYSADLPDTIKKLTIHIPWSGTLGRVDRRERPSVQASYDPITDSHPRHAGVPHRSAHGTYGDGQKRDSQAELEMQDYMPDLACCALKAKRAGYVLSIVIGPETGQKPAVIRDGNGGIVEAGQCSDPILCPAVEPTVTNGTVTVGAAFSAGGPAAQDVALVLKEEIERLVLLLDG